MSGFRKGFLLKDSSKQGTKDIPSGYKAAHKLPDPLPDDAPEPKLYKASFDEPMDIMIKNGVVFTKPSKNT